MSVRLTVTAADGATTEVVLPDPQVGQPNPQLFNPLTTILEMVNVSWKQEDVAEGPVSAWPPVGCRPRTPSQADPALQPTRLPGNGGVKFAKGTTQKLSYSGDGEAYMGFRWWVVIARCDGANNPNATAVKVGVWNTRGTTAANSQPYLYFNPKESKFYTQWADGAARKESVACSNNFDDWNIIVGHRRGWNVQISVNGVKSSGQTLKSINAISGGTCHIGEDTTTTVIPADIAIDCIIFGHAELTDALFAKLEGWAAHRVGRQAALPVDHPYRTNPPMEEPADQLPRQMYTNQEWWDWGASLVNKYALMGTPAPAPVGYSTVLFDDFTTNNTIVQALTAGKAGLWYAPGGVSGINVNAGTSLPTDPVNAYIWDGVSAMSLRLFWTSGIGWKSGSFASVDNQGRGRWWKKGIFEVRCKFPLSPTGDNKYPVGFFPAPLWSYCKEFLYWRTRNRVETDFLEYDNKNGLWLNTTMHCHGMQPSYDNYGFWPGVTHDLGATPPGQSSYKLVGREVNTANGFPFDVNIYDGEYHVWRFVVEDDLTTMIVDGHYVAQCQTSKQLLQPLYLLCDFAYRSADGIADTSQHYDMTLDYIKVMQKESELQAVPSGFSGLPTLSGIFAQGETITVTPNVTDSQIEYQWYRDAFPIFAATDQSSYTLTAAEVGKKLRVHVRAVGLYGQPEAWTMETAPIQ